jgi:hypothetical protein
VENPFMPQAVHGHNVGNHPAAAGIAGCNLPGWFQRGDRDRRRPRRDLPNAESRGHRGSAGQLLSHPDVVWEWSRLLISKYPDPLLMAVVALLVFPKLALGLSRFETGVAVMPLVQGDEGDTEDRPAGGSAILASS